MSAMANMNIFRSVNAIKREIQELKKASESINRIPVLIVDYDIFALSDNEKRYREFLNSNRLAIWLDTPSGEKQKVNKQTVIIYDDVVE